MSKCGPRWDKYGFAGRTEPARLRRRVHVAERLLEDGVGRRGPMRRYGKTTGAEGYGAVDLGMELPYKTKLGSMTSRARASARQARARRGTARRPLNRGCVAVGGGGDCPRLLTSVAARDGRRASAAFETPPSPGCR